MNEPRLYRARHLDLVEKYVMAGLFTVFAYRMIEGYLATGSWVTLIYLCDQCVILGFLLARRSSENISLRLTDWLSGVAGTFLAILIGPPGDAPLAPPFIVTALLLLGFAVHFAAKLTLRRSFGVVAANRGVKASGPYRIVRHPMYLGYVISQTGILLAGPTLANTAIIALCWAMFVVRIRGEERILMRDESYRAFAARTRYRLVPRVF